MLVLVAPGQGSQTPGFLTPWLDLPGASDQLSAWSDAAEVDLVHLGTQADAEEIRDTAAAQPLLVAAALLSAQALFDGVDPAADAAGAPEFGADAAGADAAEPVFLPAARPAVGVVAGHSVGELAAAAIAGVLSPTEALSLVRRRGVAMAEAAATTETGMSAVLGGDPEEVAERLAKLGLTAANDNGGGQVVAAGTLTQLAELAENKPERARVRPLNVAGAFHTAHMAPAEPAMAEAARGLRPADPAIRYVSNADGRAVASGAEVVRRLVAQIASPVRWDLCTETFRELGATALIELAPGGTLAGLAKRNLKGATTLALKTPADLAPARELVAEHAARPGAAEQES